MQWTVGTLAAGETWTVTYGAGIRYDYYGTDNGGTNRPYDEFPGHLRDEGPQQDAAFENTAERGRHVPRHALLGQRQRDRDAPHTRP